jgi:large subunit ribosomal protein L23
MNPMDVIRRPILSEKSIELRENANQYVFEVSLAATKDDICDAVETVFGVKPTRVATVRARGKIYRRGRHITAAKLWKKAIVHLPEGKSISVFDDQ